MNLKRLLVSLFKTVGIVVAGIIGAAIAGLVEHYLGYDSAIVAAALIPLFIWSFVYLTAYL